MTPKLDGCQIRGSVIGTFEMGGKTVIRVSITGGSLDFLSDTHDTFHLGDTLDICGEFRSSSVQPAPEADSDQTASEADFLS